MIFDLKNEADKARVMIIPDTVQYSSTSQIIEEIPKRKIPEKV